jgi:site-specific recombinase XerC
MSLMNLTNLTTESLRNLIKLTEKKEALLKEVTTIETQLSRLLSGKSVRRGRPAAKKTTVKGTKAPKSAKRAPRGAIKKKILTALKAAGDAGIKVTDLAKKTGLKNAHLHVWFSSTGSKLPEIRKVGKGHYKLTDKKA